MVTDTERLPNERLSRATDARGRPTDLLDPYTLHLLRRYEIIDAEPLRQIASDVGPGVSKWAGRGYWIGFVIGLYSLGSIVFLRSRNGPGFRFSGAWDAIAIFFFIIFFGGLYLYLRGARRARLRRVCDVMLRYLRCPHCGYDIRLLPVDSADGATVCPECGCAWRLE